MRVVTALCSRHAWTVSAQLAPPHQRTSTPSSSCTCSSSTQHLAASGGLGRRRARARAGQAINRAVIRAADACIALAARDLQVVCHRFQRHKKAVCCRADEPKQLAGSRDIAGVYPGRAVLARRVVGRLLVGRRDAGNGGGSRRLACAYVQAAAAQLSCSTRGSAASERAPAAARCMRARYLLAARRCQGPQQQQQLC